MQPHAPATTTASPPLISRPNDGCFLIIYPLSAHTSGIIKRPSTKASNKVHNGSCGDPLHDSSLTIVSWRRCCADSQLNKRPVIKALFSLGLLRGQPTKNQQQ